MSIPYVIDGETDLDATTINRWIENINTVPLASITGALEGYGPLQNMRAGVVNVLDKGADPTGNEDSYEAIQAAMAASPRVVFPSGIYMISEPIMLPQWCELYGLNRAVIRASQAMDAVIWKDNSEGLTQRRSKISGLDIDGNTYATTGLRIDYGNYFDLEDIQVLNHAEVGVDLGSTGLQVYEITGRRIRVLGAAYEGGVFVYPQPEYGFRTGTHTSDCQFGQIISKNSLYPFLDQGAANFYTQCHAYGYEEPAGMPEIAFHCKGSGAMFHQCYADGPSETGFLLDAQHISLVQCRTLWNGASPSSTAAAFRDTNDAARCHAIACVATASSGVALSSGNVDYKFTSWSNAILSPISRLTAAGGTHFNRSILPGGIQSQGMVVGATRAVSSSGAILTADHTVLADASGGAITLDLPSASSVPGREITVKRIDNSANPVVLDANGSDLIDGAGTKTIADAHGSVTVVSGGSGVWVVTVSQGTIS